MADRHIALLRGINVGRAKRIAMADLRALMGDLGYLEVLTLLNSGNIVFTVPSKVRGDHATRIEKEMTARLGVSSRVTILSAAELATIVGKNPLSPVAKDPSRLMVTVLTDAAHRSRLKPLVAQNWGQESMALGARVAYLWCPDGIIRSPLATAVGRALGDGATTRNWATMTKLHALVTAKSQ